MKNCEGCRYAKWKRTKTGRLHPDKTGRCTFEWKPPPLPASMYFVSMAGGGFPKPLGGGIERGSDLPEDCVCYEVHEEG